MEDNEEQGSGYLAILGTTRGFLRAVTILIGAGLIYEGAAALYLTQNTGTAMLANGLNLALMLVLAVTHAVTPSEVAEMRARTSARGVMRWLMLSYCIGSVVCSLYASIAFQNYAASMWFNCYGVLGTVVAGVIYFGYCTWVSSDKAISTRSIMRDGTARTTIMQTTGLFVLSFMVNGAFAGNAGPWLGAITLALATVCVFAVGHALFSNFLDIDDDRG